MDECNDYDKILQLVKSDDSYNRLLGFQLAKTIEIDLIKLFDNIVFKQFGDNIGTFYYIVGSYRINCTRLLFKLDWSFQISENNVEVFYEIIPKDCTRTSWLATKEKSINEFIKLILE